MGMDMMRYDVKRVLPQDEAEKYLKKGEYSEKTKEIKLNGRVRTWMEKNKIGREFVVNWQEYDWDKWFEQNHKFKDWSFGDYDLSLETKKKWFELVSPDGKNELFDSGFLYKNEEILVVDVEVAGYMRKPFEHSSIPSRVEGDELILTVTNFSDKGEEAFYEMQEIDPEQTKEANVFLYDVEHLKKLKKASYDPAEFERAFIDDWHDRQFAQVNW